MKKGGIIFFILFSIQLLSQNQTKNWYFGNLAGLNFFDGGVQILDDSQMSTPEGCTSISDTDGNLLFYSNGLTIWNRNHEIMENGDGIQSDVEHAQNSIIIPKPKSDSIYYLFTIKKRLPPEFDGGLYVTEIEFTDANPNGIVLQKNRQLTGFAGEKLTAVHHEDGNSIWLISISNPFFGQSNYTAFFAFNIDENGIDISPVLSPTEALSPNNSVMKISPDGKKIAVVQPTSIFIYNFDSIGGNVVLESKITTAFSFSHWIDPYGIAFSPDSKLMYYTGIEFENGIFSFIVNQYDLSSDDVFDVGETIYSEAGSTVAGSAQLAMDGKIYISYINSNNPNTSRRIGVVNEPIEQGLFSDYRHNSVNVTPGNSLQGLPNFIQSYFRNRVIVQNQCVFDPFFFSIDAYTTILSSEWDFGDGATSSELNPSHTYNVSGEYIVKATVELANNEIITLKKKVEVYPLPVLNPNQSITQCDTDSDGISVFNLFSIESVLSSENDLSLVFYKSLNDAELEQNQIPNPENYVNSTPNEEIFVVAYSPNNCKQIESFTVNTVFTPLLDISPLIACEEENNQATFDLNEKSKDIKRELNLNPRTIIRFFPNLLDAQTVTNEIIENEYVSESKELFLRLDNGDSSCGSIQSFNLVVNPLPDIPLASEYEICIDSNVNPVTLTLDSSYDRYEWKRGNQLLSTENSFRITSIGTYNVTVYKTENGLECSNSQEFVAKFPDPPVFIFVENTFFEGENTIDVSVDGDSSYQYSLDNANFSGSGTSHTFTSVEPGIRTVYVRDSQTCEPSIQDNLVVVGYPDFFTPNNDGKNDRWTIAGATSEYFKSVSIQIFNRYGKFIHLLTLQNSEFGWDGSFNGNILPSNDYWFSAQLITLDDQIVNKSGSFSLIRPQ